MKQVWITLGVFLILAFSSLGMTAGAGPGGPGSGGPGQVIGPGTGPRGEVRALWCTGEDHSAPGMPESQEDDE